MTFSFHGRAMVEHVNLRKEGATEAKHLACDIKLATVCDSAVLIPFNPALRTLLFTDAGDPRVPNIKPIGLDGSIKHLRCEFTDWRIDLDDVEAKKFSFLPMPGHRVEMVFTVAVEPGAHQTGCLAEMLGEPAMVKIGVEADLLAGLGGDAAPSEHVKELAREIIAQGPEVVEAAKAVLKARASQQGASDAARKINDLLAEDGTSGDIVDSNGNTLLTLTGADVKATKSKSQTKTAKVQPKTAKPGPRRGGPGTWDSEELAERIPLSSTGTCLVLRALDAGHNSVELRLAKRDTQALLVETGFAVKCGEETTSSRVMLRERGMILDAIHDVVSEIQGMFEWPDDLTQAMTPTWPLSKKFRNLGVYGLKKLEGRKP